MLIICNGVIVASDYILRGKIIVIDDNKIKCIQDETYLSSYPNAKVIDANGGYVLPGLIDIHSDIIKKIIVPRKGLIFDYTLALLEADKIMLNQGITTVYHSLPFSKTTVFNQSNTLSLTEICDIGKKINRTSDLLVNHKFHARLDMNTPEAIEMISMMIEANEVHVLSFMDHTPGQGQYKDIKKFKDEINKRNANISKDRIDEIIQELEEKKRICEKDLRELIALAISKNIPMAYHDVSDESQVSWMEYNNVNICEFPLNLAVGKKMLNNGLFSVVGCPNILRGKSHNKNLSAACAILGGGANIIASDYFPYGLLHAVFKLVFGYGLDLNYVVSLVTLNPAKALNISDKYGSICSGKIADLIIVDYVNDYPMIKCVIVNGTLKSSYNVTRCN